MATDDDDNDDDADAAEGDDDDRKDDNDSFGHGLGVRPSHGEERQSRGQGIGPSANVIAPHRQGQPRAPPQ